MIENFRFFLQLKNKYQKKKKNETEKHSANVTKQNKNLIRLIGYINRQYSHKHTHTHADTL